MSGPLPITETVAVHIATWNLCSRMDEAFNKCVSSILEKSKVEHPLRPTLFCHYRKIDWCIQKANVPIALYKDKLKFGHRGSNTYIQITCYYSLLVEVLTIY